MGMGRHLSVRLAVCGCKPRDRLAGQCSVEPYGPARAYSDEIDPLVGFSLSAPECPPSCVSLEMVYKGLDGAHEAIPGGAGKKQVWRRNARNGGSVRQSTNFGFARAEMVPWMAICGEGHGIELQTVAPWGCKLEATVMGNSRMSSHASPDAGGWHLGSLSHRSQK